MADLARDARAIWDAAVSGVQPAALLAKVDFDVMLDQPLSAYQRVVLVGAGKASMAMAGVLEHRLGHALDEGLIVVPYGYRKTFPVGQPSPRRVEVIEAGHPVPDEAGVRAARRLLNLAGNLGPDDLLLVALSGGGSALWPAFAEGISLDDAQATFRLLLRSGADIHAANTVRRHLSQIGGGKLTRAAYPAAVFALVISDVVGDDLAAIASGPTVPDPTMFADAISVLERFELFERVPESVRKHLLWGIDRPESEPGEQALQCARTVLIGSNRDALAAAQREAERRGYTVHVHPEPVTGEAREVGQRLAHEALAVEAGHPTCLLWGGETTVTVIGDGRGGRNQELALAAALELELDGAERDIILLSGGTDGIDGPTDAAGAWATPRTIQRARALDHDAETHLNANDAYPFFDALDLLLRPGPTHTNVMDLQVALGRP